MQLRKLFEYGLVILLSVMFILRIDKLPLTQQKTRNPSERIYSIIIFISKFFNYLALSAVFISLGLIVGILGYHWAAGLSWLDSLVEASMILSGMGPISPLSTTSAKIFASLYALFSGLIFVIAMGIVLSPLMYSLLGQFPVALKQETEQKSQQQKEEPEAEQLFSLESKRKRFQV